MLGSTVSATRLISPHDAPLTTALTPSSNQMLRSPIWNIASANASNASRHATTHSREVPARASAATDVSEEFEDRIDAPAVRSEVVAGNGDGARTVDPFRKCLRVAG